MKLYNIAVSFGEKKVLSNLSFDFPSTGVIMLEGASGSGKTTLLRVISGLSVPDEGKVERKNEKITFLFQEDRLFFAATVLENITAVGCTEKTALEELSFFGLTNEANSLPSALSGGMRRRAALARAFARGGNVYLLDEPFTGLDFDNRSKVVDRIKTLSDKALFIIASHEENKTLRELASDSIKIG